MARPSGFAVRVLSALVICCAFLTPETCRAWQNVRPNIDRVRESLKRKGQGPWYAISLGTAKQSGSTRRPLNEYVDVVTTSTSFSLKYVKVMGLEQAASTIHEFNVSVYSGGIASNVIVRGFKSEAEADKAIETMKRGAVRNGFR